MLTSVILPRVRGPALRLTANAAMAISGQGEQHSGLCRVEQMGLYKSIGITD